MYSTLFYDLDTAPKAAQAFCKTCAIELLSELAQLLIANE